MAAHFHESSDALLTAFAKTLRQALRCLHHGLDEPDYNFVIRSAALESGRGVLYRSEYFSAGSIVCRASVVRWGASSSRRAFNPTRASPRTTPPSCAPRAEDYAASCSYRKSACSAYRRGRCACDMVRRGRWSARRDDKRIRRTTRRPRTPRSPRHVHEPHSVRFKNNVCLTFSNYFTRRRTRGCTCVSTVMCTHAHTVTLRTLSHKRSTGARACGSVSCLSSITAQPPAARRRKRRGQPERGARRARWASEHRSSPRTRVQRLRNCRRTCSRRRRASDQTGSETPCAGLGSAAVPCYLDIFGGSLRYPRPSPAERHLGRWAVVRDT